MAYKDKIAPCCCGHHIHRYNAKTRKWECLVMICPCTSLDTCPHIPVCRPITKSGVRIGTGEQRP